MKNNPKLSVLTKKVRCTECNLRMNNGKQVILVFNEHNKIKAYLCSDKCLNAYREKAGIKKGFTDEDTSIITNTLPRYGCSSRKTVNNTQEQQSAAA